MNNSHFFIKNNFVHLWRAFLPDFHDKKHDLLSLLSEDELDRANRFKFPLHQERFITTRGLLRQIISLYTDVPAKDIHFLYGERGKPYLFNNVIYFNLSHSHDMAVYALSSHQAIGIDIEKVEQEFKNNIAKRFFSPLEYNNLMALPETERARGFYRIWARKEAIIKLIGEGLYIPLKKFSVSSDPDAGSGIFTFQENEYRYCYQNYKAHVDYETVIATHELVEQTIYWQWTSSLIPTMAWS